MGPARLRPLKQSHRRSDEFLESIKKGVKKFVRLRSATTSDAMPPASNRSAALARFLTGIICDVRIRRSAGEHRTRLTSANRRLRQHWPPDAMPRRCCEFVDSRLRRSPPDRASAVPYGQAGENAMRFPRLAHRSAAAHKLHSTPQQDRMNLIPGEGKTSSRLPAFSLFLPGSCPNNRNRRTFLASTRPERSGRHCLS